MTPQERMSELIEHGAAIQLLAAYPRLTLTLAGTLWLSKPKRLRWCAIVPEHQGHIHELWYTRVVLDKHNRPRLRLMAVSNPPELSFSLCQQIPQT